MRKARVNVHDVDDDPGKGSRNYCRAHRHRKKLALATVTVRRLFQSKSC